MLASLLGLAALPLAALALPCISFDSNWNLYAFGVQGQYSWSLGSQDTWSSSSGPNVTAMNLPNAPPFNGNNTQCFLAQFFNAIYVIDGDAANPNNVHIFDANKQAWTVQQTKPTSGYSPADVVAILDHDTNVFFGLSGGTLFQLDMSNQNAATSDALDWQDVNNANFKTQGYNPVMAIADNHIFFLNIPGNPAGEANIFVIHYAYFQPDAQDFTPEDGSQAFPATGGQTASIWQPSTGINPQTSFAFFPNDGSATYVVDVIHNTTSTVPYPPAPPSSGYSSFAGSVYSLVQLTPTGELYYISLNSTPSSSSSSGSSGTSQWTKIQNSLWHTPSASSQIATATAKGGQNGPAATSSSTAKATQKSSGAVGGLTGWWPTVVASLVGAAVGVLVV